MLLAAVRCVSVSFRFVSLFLAVHCSVQSVTFIIIGMARAVQTVIGMRSY